MGRADGAAIPREPAAEAPWRSRCRRGGRRDAPQVARAAHPTARASEQRLATLVTQKGEPSAVVAASASEVQREIIRTIAAGGMAEVFLARETTPEGFRRTFALKRIRSDL